jgi:hypothetical protein
MPIIELTTEIRAPIERVFDLARSIDLHVKTASGTDERAVCGVTTGLIGPDQEVTWEAHADQRVRCRPLSWLTQSENQARSNLVESL